MNCVLLNQLLVGFAVNTSSKGLTWMTQYQYSLIEQSHVLSMTAILENIINNFDDPVGKVFYLTQTCRLTQLSFNPVNIYMYTHAHSLDLRD